MTSIGFLRHPRGVYKFYQLKLWIQKFITLADETCKLFEDGVLIAKHVEVILKLIL